MAKELLEPLELRGRTVIADRGYDAQHFVDYIHSRGGFAAIPTRKIVKVQRHVPQELYRKRHRVENLFLKLKNHRRLATRY